MPPESIEDLELDLVIEAVRRRRGLDFRHYERASLKRRLARAADILNLKHVSGLIPPLLHDNAYFEDFVSAVLVSVTEFFRNPSFFLTVREHVISYLATYPRPKIWHAGCATGEEVYSLAIFLAEEGLLSRSRIYATDLNLAALNKAREGVYPRSCLEEAEVRYRAAGGRASLSGHYLTGADRNTSGKAMVMMDRALRERITWSRHDLCTGAVFSEVHLVMCRNTLIYFDRALQNRVIALLSDSLSARGFLALGDKETLELSSHQARFEPVDPREKLYRRKESARTGQDPGAKPRACG